MFRVLLVLSVLITLQANATYIVTIPGDTNLEGSIFVRDGQLSTPEGLKPNIQKIEDSRPNDLKLVVQGNLSMTQGASIHTYSGNLTVNVSGDLTTQGSIKAIQGSTQIHCGGNFYFGKR